MSDFKRIIICAAIKVDSGPHKDTVICGVRHFDRIMKSVIVAMQCHGETFIEGFMDNKYNFVTREEGCKIALESGQPMRSPPRRHGKMFSENLY